MSTFPPPSTSTGPPHSEISVGRAFVGGWPWVVDGGPLVSAEQLVDICCLCVDIDSGAMQRSHGKEMEWQPPPYRPGRMTN
ncbi:MAG: hypothetical protein JOZ32_12300 [Bryobacterales bacterium]|nr:hypothetical protein [Bryobacterales bacterium]